MREVRSQLLRPLQVVGVLVGLLAIAVIAAIAMTSTSLTHAAGTEGLVMDRSLPSAVAVVSEAPCADSVSVLQDAAVITTTTDGPGQELGSWSFVVTFDEDYVVSISTDSAATTDGASDSIIATGPNTAVASDLGTNSLASVVSALGIIMLAGMVLAMFRLRTLRLSTDSGLPTPTSPSSPSTAKHPLHHGEEGRVTAENAR